MSGGSFDYLCFRDASDLLASERKVQEMADALAKSGYADDAAKETQALLLEIRAARNRLQASIDRLAPVWKAMEWWGSCDTSEDDFKKALAGYRGEEAKEEVAEIDRKTMRKITKELEDFICGPSGDG